MKRLLAAAAALAFAASAAAQSDFPTRTVTMLVGFAPGGATDTAARIIAKKLAENLGQSVVVENKAGAGGNIAHQAVANAPADGYTILLGSVGPLAVAPHLMKLPYDPFKDLAPLTMAVTFPNVLVVHAGVPAKSFAEYLALAKAKPGSLDFASTGVGSASHLAGELLNQKAGINVVHIPYKGGGPAMTDLLGGRVGAYYSTPSTAGPHIEAGKLKALAVTSLKRSAFLPNVPTIAESGYPGFEALSWSGMSVAKGTPAPIVARLEAAFKEVMSSPAIKQKLESNGFVVPVQGSKVYSDFVASELQRWVKVIKTAGIKPQ